LPLISTLITEGWTMRAELLVGFVMIAAATPLCAQADAVSKADLWTSWRGAPVAAPDVAVRKTRTIRVVDTDMPRVFVAPTVRTISVASVPVVRVAATASATTAPSRAAVQATAVPEMNTGFAAAGLTLLLGGVAVLRSGRARFNG
jgi:hypothetical protein